MFPQRMAESLRRPKFLAEGIDPSKAPKEAAAFALHQSDAPASAAKAPVAAPASSAATSGPAKAAAGTNGLGAEKTIFDVMNEKCSDAMELFRSQTDPAAKQKAHVALHYCMGTVVCPTEAKAFMDVMEKGASDDAAVETSFGNMAACVMNTLMTKAEKERAAKIMEARAAAAHAGAAGAAAAGGAGAQQLR